MKKIEEVKRLMNGIKIAVPQNLLHLLKNDVEAALFLAQCVYWEENARKTEDGYWILTQSQVHEQLGISRKRLERIRKKLIERGYLEYRRKGIPAKSCYRLNIDCLLQALKDSACPKGTNKIAPKGQTRLSKRDKQDCPHGDKQDCPHEDKQDCPHGDNLPSSISAHLRFYRDSYRDSIEPFGTSRLDSGMGGSCVLCGTYSELNINNYSDEFKKRLGLWQGYICTPCLQARIRARLMEVNHERATGAASE